MPTSISNLPRELHLMILNLVVRSTLLAEVAINQGIFYAVKNDPSYHLITIHKTSSATQPFRRHSSIANLRQVNSSWDKTMDLVLQVLDLVRIYHFSGLSPNDMKLWIAETGEKSIGRMKRWIMEGPSLTQSCHPTPCTPLQLFIRDDLPSQVITDATHINITSKRLRQSSNDIDDAFCPDLISINTDAFSASRSLEIPKDPYFGMWSMNGQYWGSDMLSEWPSHLLAEIEGWHEAGSAATTSRLLLRASTYLSHNGCRPPATDTGGCMHEDEELQFGDESLSVFDDSAIADMSGLSELSVAEDEQCV